MVPFRSIVSFSALPFVSWYEEGREKAMPSCHSSQQQQRRLQVAREQVLEEMGRRVIGARAARPPRPRPYAAALREAARGGGRCPRSPGSGARRSAARPGKCLPQLEALDEPREGGLEFRGAELRVLKESTGTKSTKGVRSG